MILCFGEKVYSPKGCPVEGEAGPGLEDSGDAKEEQDGGTLEKMLIEIALLGFFLAREHTSLWSSEKLPDS